MDSEWVVSASAENIDFVLGVYDTGSVSLATDVDYVGLFASTSTTVVFAKDMPKIPKINLRPISGGGVIGASVSNLNLNQFSITTYGVLDGGATVVEWDAIF
jgi:hypothetical protein